MVSERVGEGKIMSRKITPLPEWVCWVVGGGITIASIASLIFTWPISPSILIAGILCFFLGSLIWECASRTKVVKEKYLKLPNKNMALILFLLLLLSNVTVFANIYKKTGEIKYGSEVLSEKSDAFYFSAVTVTTLGYGEFHPTEKRSRKIVVFHLFSGMLLLLFALPILASRISSWEEMPEVNCLLKEGEEVEIHVDGNIMGKGKVKKKKKKKKQGQ